MAEPLRPTSVKAFGKQNWIFVPTIASVTAPTAAEITGAAALDITNIAFADSAPAPTQSTNVVEQEHRFGDTRVGQFVGVTTYQGGEMTYQFDPQGAALSNGVKLWEKIPEGTTGYLVRRIGVPKATTPIAGQFVDLYPVEFGPSQPGTMGDAEAAEGAATVTFAITDPANVKFKVAIA